MPKPKPKPQTHGGARPGAGRRPSGRVTINANVSRATADTLRARAAQLARIAGHKRPQLGAAIDAAVLGDQIQP